MYVRKKSPKACWVKGRLQPTRSLGDFYLKHKEFTISPFVEDKEYRKTFKTFNGPYINYLPEIKIYNLEKNDRFIVLGTDGLWDELTPKDVGNIIKSNQESKKDIANALFYAAIDHAAKEANLTREEIMNIAQGTVKRGLHDDITIMIVDLKNQYS